MSLERIIQTLDQIVPRLEQNLREAISYDALLKRVNDHEDIYPTFNNTVEAHGFAAINHGLINLYVLSLNRCFDSRADNRASLPHVMELLRNQEVIDALALRARAWQTILADQNEMTARGKIEVAVTTYTTYNGDGGFQTALTALRQYRDDNLAHNLMEMGEREQVLFGYLGDVLAVALPIVTALSLGIIGVEWDANATIRVWNVYADRFWMRTLPA